MSFPRTVADERSIVHRLHPEPLGRGGQGVVFRTMDPGIVVKLITTERRRETDASMRATARLYELLDGTQATDLLKGDEAQQRLRLRLDDVRLLPLDDLHIARPLSLLRGEVGYTMQLLSDMEPIRSLIAPAGHEDLAGYYIETGGLRRRLLLLSQAARLLSRVHAVPAVYGDISPNNVFVSTDRDSHEVWLIDPDNLHLEGTPGPVVYTPGFGAPEVVQGKARATTLSDAWSFAVLAFWTLCQAHPFLGEQIEEGGWELSVDLEEQAFAGHLPWIHDEEDDSNYGENGIFPRELALSARLTQLFGRTLGPGRLDPVLRPGLAEYAEVLCQAAHLTLTCPTCGSTFFVSARRCPWCEAAPAPDFLYIKVSRWEPEVDEDIGPAGGPVWNQVIDGSQERATLGRLALTPSLVRHEDEPWLRLDRTRRGYSLTTLAGGPYLIVETETGQITDLSSTHHLPLPRAGREWHLHCGPMDRGHRVASFRYFDGESA